MGCGAARAQVAWTGHERLRLGVWQAPPAPGKVQGNVEALPRWPLGPLDPRSSTSGMDKCKMYH